MQRGLQDERLGSGFTADLTVTNRGTDVIDGWTLTYSYTGNQRLVNGWNGSWSQSGPTVTVRNAGHNGRIAAGGAVTTGAQFSYSGSNAAPASFAVNGTTCAGAHQPPIAVLTSPEAGSVYTQGETVPLAATAAAADRATVTKVEFYDDTELLGTDTSAPYTLAVGGLSVGAHSLVAKAYDSLGASASSTPVGITVASGPAVVASPSQLGVRQGESGTFEVKLSKQPSADVTVTTARASGNTGLSVSSGAALTFTPSNWNTAQKVTVAADDSGTGSAVFESSAPGHAKAAVTVTQLGATKSYEARFLELYDKITDPANGYFSPEGIPYHSVETLIVEAPDHGHETTSEAYSYLLWLQAMYGRITGDWTRFNSAWETMERYAIPTAADQPTTSFYDPSKPATYAPEHDTPDEYPSQLDSSVSVGRDPIAAELKSAYGTDNVYGMHWIQDVDNVYGYGNSPGKCEAGPSDTGPSYINTFQRGPQESVWETVTQPTCDAFKYGGTNGYLDLFTKDASYARQWKFTNAPDADARGAGGVLGRPVGEGAGQGRSDRRDGRQGRQDGRLPALRDVRQVLQEDRQLHQPVLPGRHRQGRLALPALLVLRLGRRHRHLGGLVLAHRLQPRARRLPEPARRVRAANNYAPLKPKSATGAEDWNKSFQRQLEFYRWLQSAEGGIAGGATNSWAGRYTTPPSGTPTFYGMYYDEKPVYHDPPSNQWFGFQAWSMERVAEVYQQTGNALAKSVLDKWVDWALSETTVNPDGSFLFPSTLKWSGKPDTWNASSPGANNGLHVEVVDYTNDVGVAGAYAKILTYYAARSGDTEAADTAKALLDGMWENNQDDLGIAVPETRADYERFDDPVHVPSGWTGTMPNGDRIDSSSTFLSIRSFYQDDPAWSKIESYLKGGAAPVFTYHRFWAQADIATAMGAYAELLE